MYKKVSKLSELNKEDTYRYKGFGFEVSDAEGTHTVSKGAEYDVKVVQITNHTITLRMKVDQSTIRRACCWDSRPYNWAISVYDFNHGIESLYKETYEK